MTEHQPHTHGRVSVTPPVPPKVFDTGRYIRGWRVRTEEEAAREPFPYPPEPDDWPEKE